MTARRTSVDFERVGTVGEVFEAVRDINRNGEYVSDAMVASVSGTTVTLTSSPVPTHSQLLGFVLSFGVADDDRARVKLGITTRGFAGVGGNAVDREISKIDLTATAFDVYVLFGSYGRTPQDARVKICNTVDSSARITLTGVPTAYSSSLSAEWISADSAELQELADALRKVV